jgi:hypothetical protein
LSRKIFVFDEIVVPHTQLERLRRAYLDEYAPGARARGMTLEGAWRSPPIDLPDRASTLHFLWSVPNVGAWWRMRAGARATGDLNAPPESHEDKARWWSFVDSIAVSRKRTIMTDAGEGSKDV